MSENSSRWKKGQSGNPSGRKPGTGRVAELRAGLAECLPEVLSNLSRAAVAGDMQATRILLDRVLPPLRVEETLVFIEMPPESSLSQKADKILSAASSGQIGVGQAAQMISAIGLTARIHEAEGLSRRVEALEVLMAGAK